MDRRFSPEDEQYQQTLRTWLEANKPRNLLRKTRMPSLPIDGSSNASSLSGGLVGINWPKEYGGQGATLI